MRELGHIWVHRQVSQLGPGDVVRDRARLIQWRMVTVQGATILTDLLMVLGSIMPQESILAGRFEIALMFVRDSAKERADKALRLNEEPRDSNRDTLLTKAALAECQLRRLEAASHRSCQRGAAAVAAGAGAGGSRGPEQPGMPAAGAASGGAGSGGAAPADDPDIDSLSPEARLTYYIQKVASEVAAVIKDLIQGPLQICAVTAASVAATFSEGAPGGAGELYALRANNGGTVTRAIQARYDRPTKELVADYLIVLTNLCLDAPALLAASERLHALGTTIGEVNAMYRDAQRGKVRLVLMACAAPFSAAAHKVAARQELSRQIAVEVQAEGGSEAARFVELVAVTAGLSRQRAAAGAFSEPETIEALKILLQRGGFNVVAEASLGLAPRDLAKFVAAKDYPGPPALLRRLDGAASLVVGDFEGVAPLCLAALLGGCGAQAARQLRPPRAFHRAPYEVLKSRYQDVHLDHLVHPKTDIAFAGGAMYDVATFFCHAAGDPDELALPTPPEGEPLGDADVRAGLQAAVSAAGARLAAAGVDGGLSSLISDMIAFDVDHRCSPSEATALLADARARRELAWRADGAAAPAGPALGAPAAPAQGRALAGGAAGAAEAGGGAPPPAPEGGALPPPPPPLDPQDADAAEVILALGLAQHTPPRPPPPPPQAAGGAGGKGKMKAVKKAGAGAKKAAGAGAKKGGGGAKKVGGGPVPVLVGGSAYDGGSEEAAPVLGGGGVADAPAAAAAAPVLGGSVVADAPAAAAAAPALGGGGVDAPSAADAAAAATSPVLTWGAHGRRAARQRPGPACLAAAMRVLGEGSAAHEAVAAEFEGPAAAPGAGAVQGAGATPGAVAAPPAAQQGEEELEAGAAPPLGPDAAGAAAAAAAAPPPAEGAAAPPARPAADELLPQLCGADSSGAPFEARAAGGSAGLAPMPQQPQLEEGAAPAATTPAARASASGGRAAGDSDDSAASGEALAGADAVVQVRRRGGPPKAEAAAAKARPAAPAKAEAAAAPLRRSARVPKPKQRQQ
ncbi:MAG: hypothetical protein J3K34DRAFT_511575 [Monoraphidium minutum]|nr:MAG: hypothetical protein J3K34DRAFT_511575 [Monoraphidium minutum]